MSFDTAAGFSYLRCKPCRAGDGPCDTAFNPSLSSSFASIPCSSPECAASCSRQRQGQTCPFRYGVDKANGTFVKDTLTLSSSATVEGFTFGCTGFLDPNLFYGAARNNCSLASRAAPSSTPTDNGGAAITFSYCLPSNLSSHGLLSISPSRSLYSGRQDVQYAPLVDNTAMPVIYFIELVRIWVTRTELPIPPSAPIDNFTLVNTARTFSFIVPYVYAPLRDKFQRQLARYPMAASLFDGLDTCYNFTGLDVIRIPSINLEFAGGSSLELILDQVLYFTDRADYFSIACLAFGEMDPANTFPVSVIGNLGQRSAEMIYDVQGGKLGFAQGAC